jgi:hypothetical protein
VLEDGEGIVRAGGCDLGFRTERITNLDARSALRRSPLDRRGTEGLTSVTTCHTSSQSVTLRHNCDTLRLRPSGSDLDVELSVLHGPSWIGRMV